jgi:hypothetical protein
LVKSVASDHRPRSPYRPMLARWPGDHSGRDRGPSRSLRSPPTLVARGRPGALSSHEVVLSANCD